MLSAPNAITTMRFSELVDRLVQLSASPVIVAIDGPGGAGKTTFADRLIAAAVVETTLLHTDEFARPDEPTGWWPRLLEVIESLAAGERATYDPFDWNLGSTGASRNVGPTRLIVIEGVSSSRPEWSALLSFAIWIDARPDLCQERGVARDDVTAEEWDKAAEDEAAFFDRDRAAERANLIVDASATSALPDPEISFAARA